MTTDEEVIKLVRDLREMDQLVFQMGQCTDAASLRSLLQRALAITNERMSRESNRIRDLLIPEIRKVYTEPAPKPIFPPLKSIEHKS